MGPANYEQVLDQSRDTLQAKANNKYTALSLHSYTCLVNHFGMMANWPWKKSLALVLVK